MLKTGKLDSQLLENIVFENIKCKRPEVLVRPGIGEDCASVDFGDYICVMSTDPITASIKDIGRLAIHISCNDIATNGIEPLGIMLSVMLPVGSTEEDVESMMKQAGLAAAQLNVEIIGGHTEITPAVNTPVIVSTAIGRKPKANIEQSKIKNGDSIYMTKWAGLEGTAIIASDFKEQLKNVLTEEDFENAEELFNHISVVKEGVVAGKIGTTGMHDVTEGGILGAIWELCHVGKVGAEIFLDEIPVLDISKKICKRFDIDVYRLISSGCMIIIIPEGKGKMLEEAIEKLNINLTLIGKIKEVSEGLFTNKKGKKVEIHPPESDELYKVVGR